MPEEPSRTSLKTRIVAGFTALMLLAGPALALSEIKTEEVPATGPAATEEQGERPAVKPPSGPVPLPDPIAPLPGSGRSGTETPEQAAPPSETGEPAVALPPPEILRDIELLPGPVKRMRELIMEACRSGDIENLRPLIGTAGSMTTLSFGGEDGDPIEYLRGTSGDPDGTEILAILLEVLEAGFVHLDEGAETELYVWPYFFAVPLDKLTKPQKVELFKLVTAGDYEDMQSFGAYIFFRVGITPEGRWAFFVAGD